MIMSVAVLVAGKRNAEELMRLTIGAALVALVSCANALAQVSVGGSGLPNYSVPITVPPGIAGMTPQLSFLFAGAGVNGPEGFGWSVQGTSVITRCPSTLDIDGASTSVTYAPADRLCLDGQRLVRTDAAGVPKSTTDDANGISGTEVREFRTEKDSFVRVRAYGHWGNLPEYGPKWFRVWTKAGQIFDYGSAPSNPSGAIVVEKPGVTDPDDRPVMTWAIARQSDTLGNYIDFSYTRRAVNWGSGAVANTPTAGAEWYVQEIRYTGFSGSPIRLPNNKIVFDYEDRPQTYTDRPYDPAEAYQAGYKNVSLARLKRIRSFIGTNLAEPVLVRTLIPTYASSPVTGRSRITQIKECFGEGTTAGEPGSKCTQPTKFSYADSGDSDITMNDAFNLKNAALSSSDSTYGILTADFNGDGRTDILKWHDDPDLNRLYHSDGDGSFTQNTSLNLPHQLMRSDGCYYSSVIDMNADGLPDILRFAGKTKLTDGGACPVTPVSHVFINDGAGNFSPRAIQVKPLSGSVINAELKRQTSKDQSEQYCNPPPFAPGSVPTGSTAAQFDPQACRTGHGWTYGATFYFLDVNLDGRPDLVTTELPAHPPQDPGVDGENFPSCPFGVTCTRVYVDDGTGLLVERASNINGKSLYSNPGVADDYQYVKHLGNVDGDALVDLVSVGKKDSAGHWRSDGTGNFSLASGASNCERPIDFNGDGRTDCLYASKTGASGNLLYVSTGAQTSIVADFNLKSAGFELEPPDTLPIDQRYGHFVIDLNGDDRADILRWHDDANLNKVLLSNGGGTFRLDTPVGYTNTRFMSSNGMYATIQADFLGKGTLQLLRLAVAAPDGGDNRSMTNNLYVRANPMLPDRLLSVTSPTGLVSDITYATVANAPSGRYTSDRGTSFDAAYPTMDVAFPMPIVTTVETDTGVGATRVKTEYAYLGLKADAQGDGLLGFRETRVQSRAPDGSAMTTATRYNLRRPYAGVARRTESRLATLAGFDAADTVSRTINIYCDKTSATAPADATEAAPCATEAKVTRPYLYKSTETGFDIDAARTALPTVITTNTFDNQGNVTEVTVQTKASFDGTMRTHTKVTNNVYTWDTSLDRWILGRLKSATVQSTVPNLDLTPSVGTAPYAGWTDGGGVNQGAQALNAPAKSATTKRVTKRAAKERLPAGKAN